MIRIVLSEGAHAGAALGICIALLAVIGLTPSFSCVPELPLLAVAVVLPVLVYGMTGYRAGLRSRRMVGGLLASAVAGAVGGAVVGAVGAQLSLRSRSASL